MPVDTLDIGGKGGDMLGFKAADGTMVICLRRTIDPHGVLNGHCQGSLEVEFSHDDVPMQKFIPTRLTSEQVLSMLQGAERDQFLASIHEFPFRYLMEPVIK